VTRSAVTEHTYIRTKPKGTTNHDHQPHHRLDLRPGRRRLGVGVLDIRRAVRHETIPVVRVGDKIRIPADWVDEITAREQR
jgi:excisionase family DNA binding protein